MKYVFLLIPLFFIFHCTLPEPDDEIPPQTVVIYPYEGAVISDILK